MVEKLDANGMLQYTFLELIYQFYKTWEINSVVPFNVRWDLAVFLLV